MTTLARLHRRWLMQSVTLPHIITAELEQRKRQELIAEIGRLNRLSEPLPAVPSVDRAEVSNV